VGRGCGGWMGWAVPFWQVQCTWNHLVDVGLKIDRL
jgi:hypothetical protein